MAFAQQVRAPTTAPNMSIGLNWLTGRYPSPAGTDTIVWHNGGTGGYRTFIGFEPSKKIGVIVMTNSGGAGADDIGLHLLDAGIPLVPKPTAVKARTAIDVAPAVLARYVGVYQLAPAFSMEVSLADGALYVQATGRGKLRLFADTEVDFFLKEVDAQVTFTRDPQGAVTGLVLHQNGANQTAKKVK